MQEYFYSNICLSQLILVSMHLSYSLGYSLENKKKPTYTLACILFCRSTMATGSGAVVDDEW
ncbi:hypothetical protein BgiMline_032579, partial [Biomphalaria glabrata]